MFYCFSAHSLYIVPGPTDTMYNTVIKHAWHLRTLEKCRKHSPLCSQMPVVFKSQCNTRYLNHMTSSRNNASPPTIVPVNFETNLIRIWVTESFVQLKLIRGIVKTGNSQMKSPNSTQLYLHRSLRLSSLHVLSSNTVFVAEFYYITAVFTMASIRQTFFLWLFFLSIINCNFDKVGLSVQCSTFVHSQLTYIVKFDSSYYWLDE